VVEARLAPTRSRLQQQQQQQTEELPGGIMSTPPSSAASPSVTPAAATLRAPSAVVLGGGARAALLIARQQLSAAANGASFLQHGSVDDAVRGSGVAPFSVSSAADAAALVDHYARAELAADQRRSAGGSSGGAASFALQQPLSLRHPAVWSALLWAYASAPMAAYTDGRVDAATVAALKAAAASLGLPPSPVSAGDAADSATAASSLLRIIALRIPAAGGLAGVYDAALEPDAAAVARALRLSDAVDGDVATPTTVVGGATAHGNAGTDVTALVPAVPPARFGVAAGSLARYLLAVGLTAPPLPGVAPPGEAEEEPGDYRNGGRDGTASSLLPREALQSLVASLIGPTAPRPACPEMAAADATSRTASSGDVASAPAAASAGT
jgi:hypothetical protein